MPLSPRQISIVAYLVNRADWVSSDQMSAHFRINRKTVQQEMRTIQDFFGSKIVLNVNAHRGYRLEQISQSAQDELTQAAADYGGIYNCLPLRPSTLVLYLLFLKDYISMQELADTFFYSKTAIALEMENVRRWCERQTDLTLEISRTKGIRIHASEYRKRIFCVNFGTRAAFQSLPFDDDIKDFYASTLLSARGILQQIVSDSDSLISGESMLKITRFTAVSILRNRMGYQMTEDVPDHPKSDTVKTFAYRLNKEHGFTLNAAEQKSIALLFDNCDHLLSEDIPLSISSQMEASIQQFEHNICQIIGQPDQTLFPNRDAFASCLKAMQTREQNHDTAINHYNEKIVALYPLSVHLTHRFLKNCFGLSINKETSFLALFVAEALKTLSPKPSILLLSNQNLAVTEQIRSSLYRECTVKLGPIRAVPPYYVAVHPELLAQYSFIVTTQQELVLQHPEYYLLPPILTDSTIREFDYFLQENIRDRQTAQQQEIKEHYFQKTIISTPCSSLEQLIGLPDNEAQTYHLFGNGNLHIVRICPQAETLIRIFELKHPLPFRMKSVQRVIVSSLCPGNVDALLFYQTVAELLKEYS